MAGAVVSVYSGIPGSGKSYEVVANVILPALRMGRRVVATVDGLDVPKISAFIGRDVTDLLVCVTDEQLDDPRAWPNEGQIKSGNYSASLIKGGDLVVIDEAGRQFGSHLREIPQFKVEFFRYARHAVANDCLRLANGEPNLTKKGEEIKTTCNVVMMIQTYTDLHKQVRGLVGTSFRAFKHTALGTEKRYRLRNFDGSMQTRGSMLQQWQLTYDPKIFPLYKSHAEEGATEHMVDKRQVIWRHPKMIWFAVLFVLGIGVAVGLLMYAKSRVDKKFLDKKNAEVQNVEGSTPVPAAGGVQASPPVAKAEVPRAVLGQVIQGDGYARLILDTPDGIRLVSTDGFTLTEVGSYGSYEGVRYSSDVRPASAGGTAAPGGLSFGGSK